MIKNFVFNDIVLYAKGWYEKTDIINDLGYLFSKVYGWKPTTEKEVSRMMLRVLDKVYTEKGVTFNSNYRTCYVGFFDEIEKRMSIYDQTFENACICYVLSELFELRTDEIELNAPIYGKKEHFRMGQTFGGKYPISMTYKEMNRIARKTFSK